MAKQGRIPEDEYDERIEFTISLIARMNYKSEIKRKIKEEFDVSARTAEEYISRGRERIREQIALGMDEQRATIAATFLDMIKDPTSTKAERARAAREYSRLMGLEGPKRISITDSEGKNIEPQSIDARITALLAGLVDTGTEGGATGTSGSEVESGSAGGPGEEAEG